MISDKRLLAARANDALCRMKNGTVTGVLVLLALSQIGNAQETVNGGNVFLGPLRSNGSQAVVDFTAAASTSPVKSGTLAARPGSCTVGQMYFATDAAAGQNLAFCTSGGTWTSVSGGGAVLPGGVNAQTGTSYTFLDGDAGKLVTLNNASAVGVTLPRAGASSWFMAGWVADVQNRGAGNVTITPATSTIDGASSLVLTQNQGARIFSDGSNYFTERGVGSAAQAANAYTNTSAMSSVAQYNNPEPCVSGVIPASSFNASAASQQIAIATVPAKWVPRSVQVEETVAIICNSGCNTSSGAGGMSAWQLSVGTAGSPAYYLNNYVAGSSPAFKSDDAGGQPVQLTSHVLNLQLGVTNANPGNLGSGSGSGFLTAGSLTVRVCGAVLQ